MIRNPIAHASWLFIAVILAAVSGWYYVSTDNPYVLDKHTLNHMPDIIAKQVHLTQFDDNGAIKHDMLSTTMTHQPADDRYLFVSPIIHIRDDNQSAPWKITAKKALTYNGSKLIELVESVHLCQQIDKNRFNEIITEQLYYQPNKKFAYTDLPIEFNQPGANIKAIGMQAELDRKQVKLLNRAQGAFIHEKS